MHGRKRPIVGRNYSKFLPICELPYIVVNHLMTVNVINRRSSSLCIDNSNKRSDRPDRFRSLTTVNCQRFSLRCWGKVFQWLPKDWHKKVSYFCKMKFVHVHFAAVWMNKFPNRGRYQIANIISWQNSLYCSQPSTSSVIFNNFNN